MGRDENFELSPALLSRTGAPHGLSAGSLVGAQEPRLPTALVLTPIFNRETSSSPMKFPPFVIRLPSPPGLMSYPSFPSTD
jgi:hypothetical protein